MRITNLVFVFVCTLILCSCKKETPQATPARLITLLGTATLDEWVNFKTGTYWIYRDSVSGKTDSVYVTKNTAITYKHSTVTEDIYETQFVIDITSDSSFFYQQFILTSYP